MRRNHQADGSVTATSLDLLFIRGTIVTLRKSSGNSLVLYIPLMSWVSFVTLYVIFFSNFSSHLFYSSFYFALQNARSFLFFIYHPFYFNLNILWLVFLIVEFLYSTLPYFNNLLLVCNKLAFRFFDTKYSDFFILFPSQLFHLHYIVSSSLVKLYNFITCFSDECFVFDSIGQSPLFIFQSPVLQCILPSYLL